MIICFKRNNSGYMKKLVPFIALMSFLYSCNHQTKPPDGKFDQTSSLTDTLNIDPVKILPDKLPSIVYFRVPETVDSEGKEAAKTCQGLCDSVQPSVCRLLNNCRGTGH